MKRLELTDDALAKLVNCSRPTITKLRHRTITASLDLAVLIHAQTGIPYDQLVKQDAKAPEAGPPG